MAFFLAAYLLESFVLDGDILSLATTIAVFTLINVFIRPIIKGLLSPIIFLTLGLFSLVINAAILYSVDIYSSHISIDGLSTLAYATVIITLVNLVMSWPRGIFKKREI